MNDYTSKKTYLYTTILFYTLFLVGIAFSQSPTKPTLALVEDTGTDTSDNRTNNSAIAISSLTDGNSWSFKIGEATEWTTGGTVSGTSATFDPFYLISGTMVGTPTLSVTSKQNQTSLGSTFPSYYSANSTGHTFFFDVTTPSSSTNKEILFF